MNSTIGFLIRRRFFLKQIILVEITKTVPLEKLVWAPIKDPDNEIKTIHNRTEDPHPSGC
jgi:hypothetical protein